MEYKGSRDGGFSDPSYISVGDPYVDKKDPKARGIGEELKPFTTCPAKHGQLAATFGPGHRHFEGLRGEYSEQYKLEAKRRLENTKKFVKPNGFVYSSPAEKQTGSGDDYGLFSVIKRDEDDVKKQQEENEKAKAALKDVKGREFEKKNILTHPGKRGTFGYAGTLIGGAPTPILDVDFDSEQREQRKKSALHKVLQGNRKPFKSTIGPADYFDGQEHVEASRVFSWDEQSKLKPPIAEELMNPKERAAAKASTFKPWKPNDTIKFGENGTFEKFPEQLADPYDERVVNRAMLPNRRNPVKIKMKDLPASIRERKPFRPSNGVLKTKLTKGTCLVGITKHNV